MKPGSALLSALVVCLSWGRPSAFERTWAPLLDQFAQRHLETHGTRFLDHPDFPEGQGRDTTRAKIALSLRAAHSRGVRTIDVQFFLSRDMLQEDYGRAYPATDTSRPPISDPTLPGFVHSGQDWVEAVDAFNRARPEEPLKLRIRISAHASLIHYVFRTLKPYRTHLPAERPGEGLVRSRFGRLPLDPCFEKLDPADPCFKSTPIASNFYRTRDENGRWNNVVPNLANPAIREAIATWAGMAVDEVFRLTAGSTVVEEASLALDAGFESSLFIHDGGGIAVFGDSTYRKDMPLQAKWAFFRNREDYLRSTYRAFADSVHRRKNKDGTPVKAGIFFQIHHMDGRSRGSFDLYSLLKGTGVDVIHHTHPPLTLDQSLMLVAYTASAASALGIGFDTEFSWAHFGGKELLRWDRGLLTSGNALAFLRQAHAGALYGGSGIVYANWAMQVMVNPPAARRWEDILDRAGAIASIKPLRDSAVPAIYVSSMGRLACEEARILDGPKDEGCDVHTLFSWFEELGLNSGAYFRRPLYRGKIPILSDGMILDSKVPWERLAAIYVPYQTSLRMDPEVRARLENLPRETKSRFRIQRKAGAPPDGGFDEWIRKVR